MSNPLKLKQKFAEKFRQKTYYEELTSKEQFEMSYLPIPNKQYCYVCQNEFKNYYQHIRQSEHNKNENRGQANQYIE